MVIPFSNTKLRVPKGFQSLLVGLSTEILRSQPRNIHQFAADYFDKLIQRREQGQSYSSEKQTALEDRYYNNQSFKEEYPVNDPEVNQAATRIQANFRGHKARQDAEKMKQESNALFDSDQQELGYGQEQSTLSNENEFQRLSTGPLSDSQQYKQNNDTVQKSNGEEDEDDDHSIPRDDPNEMLQFEKENSEIERQEKERAESATQERYRGYRERKSAKEQGQSADAPAQLSGRNDQQDFDNDRASTTSSTRFSEKIDSDRHDLSENLTADGQFETGENDDTDRPRLQRETTQLSEDFERHTQVPTDSGFDRELRPELNNDEKIMNHSDLDKAAIRIQASYRGYRTRKELDSSKTHDQYPSSTLPHGSDEYERAPNKTEDAKEAEGDDDDNAAAIKIQAAYRGYRVRRDLEK